MKTLKTLALTAGIAIAATGGALATYAFDPLKLPFYEHAAECGRFDLSEMMEKAAKKMFAEDRELKKQKVLSKTRMVGFSFSHDAGPNSMCVFKVDYVYKNTDGAQSVSVEVEWEPKN